jgi:hypothetical protein
VPRTRWATYLTTAASKKISAATQASAQKSRKTAVQLSLLTNPDIVSPNKTDSVVRTPPVMSAFRQLTLTEKRPQPKSNATLAVMIPGFYDSYHESVCGVAHRILPDSICVPQDRDQHDEHRHRDHRQEFLLHVSPYFFAEK